MRNVLNRVGYALIVMLLVTMSTVALLSLAPGSIAENILGEGATPENVVALSAELGLDQPVWTQYLNWIGSAVRGDLGTSPLTGVPVMEAVLDRIPVSLEIALLALLISFVTSVVLAEIGRAHV